MGYRIQDRWIDGQRGRKIERNRWIYVQSDKEIKGQKDGGEGRKERQGQGKQSEEFCELSKPAQERV